MAAELIELGMKIKISRREAIKEIAYNSFEAGKMIFVEKSGLYKRPRRRYNPFQSIS